MMLAGLLEKGEVVASGRRRLVGRFVGKVDEDCSDRLVLVE
jgi:hypothetical protein